MRIAGKRQGALLPSLRISAEKRKRKEKQRKVKNEKNEVTKRIWKYNRIKERKSKE